MMTDRDSPVETARSRFDAETLEVQQHSRPAVFDIPLTTPMMMPTEMWIPNARLETADPHHHHQHHHGSDPHSPQEVMGSHHHDARGGAGGGGSSGGVGMSMMGSTVSSASAIAVNGSAQEHSASVLDLQETTSHVLTAASDVA